MIIDITEYFKFHKIISTNTLHSACNLQPNEKIIGGYIKGTYSKEILWRNGTSRITGSISLFIMDTETEQVHRITAKIDNVKLKRMDEISDVVSKITKSELITRMNNYIIEWYPTQDREIHEMIDQYFHHPDVNSIDFKTINTALSRTVALIVTTPSKRITIEYLAKYFMDAIDATTPCNSNDAELTYTYEKSDMMTEISDMFETRYGIHYQRYTIFGGCLQRLSDSNKENTKITLLVFTPASDEQRRSWMNTDTFRFENMRVNISDEKYHAYRKALSNQIFESFTPYLKSLILTSHKWIDKDAAIKLLDGMINEFKDGNESQYNELMNRIMSHMRCSGLRYISHDVLLDKVITVLKIPKINKRAKTNNSCETQHPWDWLFRPKDKEPVRYITIVKTGTDECIYHDIDIMLNIIGASSNKTPMEIYREYLAPNMQIIIDDVKRDILNNRSFKNLGIPLSFYKITDVIVLSDYRLNIKLSMRIKP